MATAPQRISTLEARMDEHSRSIGDLRGLMLALDQKWDRRFMWLIGMQFTTLLALVASMVTVITALLRR